MKDFINASKQQTYKSKFNTEMKQDEYSAARPTLKRGATDAQMLNWFPSCQTSLGFHKIHYKINLLIYLFFSFFKTLLTVYKVYTHFQAFEKDH